MLCQCVPVCFPVSFCLVHIAFLVCSLLFFCRFSFLSVLCNKQNLKERDREKERETERKRERERERERDVALTVFFTHLLAWPCGSMKRGQRLENCVTIPFSTESVSRGSPANCQLRMLTGSPRILRMVELGVCGNDFATNDFIQSAIIAVRYSPWVNTERNVSE